MTDEEQNEQPEEWTPQEQPTGSAGQSEEDEEEKQPSPSPGRAIGGGSARGS